ncbi:MAG: sulfotransferase [Solirubrobacterales bacterium]
MPAPAPFVCGVTRSGTTLARLMLDSHPDLAIPGETHWVPKLIRRVESKKRSPDELAEIIIGSKRWQEFHLDADALRERFDAMPDGNAAEAIRAFYLLYAEREGKTRYGDKTPGYIKEMVRIQRALPEAHFIHIIRDGRDVSLSHMRMNWGPKTYEESAQLWVDRITKARRKAPKVEHYHEIHFEDLVRDTEATLRKVCDIIQLDYDPAMLNYHERAAKRLEEKNVDLVRRHGPTQPAAARMESHKLAKEPPREDRLGAWRRKMTPEEIASYESIAGPLLVELGYELAA